MSSSEDEFGPALPPGFAKPGKNDSSSSEDDTFGPALPPKSSSSTSSTTIGPTIPAHLVNRQPQYSSDSESDSDSDSDVDKRRKQTNIGPVRPSAGSIGPALPAHLSHLSTAGPIAPNYDPSDDSDDDDGYMIGPSVGLIASDKDKSSAAEFESRAEQMRERLTGKPEEDIAPARETWMTELPSNMGKQFGLEPRQFRKNAAPEQDSSWLDTPQDVERKEKEGKKKRKRDRDELVPTEKDIKVAKELEEYNRKHRPKSLLEMHEKDRKKKKKKEKKKNKDKKPERRPFDRDVDLEVNKMDDAKRRAIIKRSQELGSRFKSGGTGTSFL